MYLTQDYKDIIELFNKYDVKFLIAGAYAMSKVGYSRSTYYIDLWIEKSEQNANNIFKALDEFGIPFAIEPSNFLEENSVLQIGIEPNRIDILTDIDGLEFTEAWKNRQLVEFDELKAFSLEINDIIKNKKASNRAKDKLDLVQLEELAQLKN
ncbi:hypothetical protein [Sulfurospirillum arcachonense]|uniref:hypothetical protein n=1 Tax=Sulfurospirillum arcachonense TaxID=57666 RepID=UPI0004696815|nr:hypothetical protein [Sulfurospirillum arcachonense]